VYETVADIMQGKPDEQFPKPDDNKMAFGDQRTIPDVTCFAMSDAKSRLQNSGFTVSVGSPIDSKCPANTAAQTSPSGKTIKGGVVVISPSTGNGGGQQIPGFPGVPPPNGPGRPRR
jgi:beta-lactam-binding protein with PASTA domain